jgi:hypothetical protein
MDQHALDYYSPYSESHMQGHFHQVIALHDNPLLEWEQVLKLAPKLCRGWYELAQLSQADRVEFIRDFWLTKLPYEPQLQSNLMQFFASLDDIGVFLTQQTFDDVYEAELVYSLAGDSGFFRGKCQASASEITELQKLFPDYNLPIDYLSFLQIHNGFAKQTDTGITPSRHMLGSYEIFQALLEEQEPMKSASGALINPKALIPFYESFGMPFYQCFWADWYSEQTMGNVYYSGLTHTISPIHKTNDCIETMAFETFTRWLIFYLEKID